MLNRDMLHNDHNISAGIHHILSCNPDLYAESSMSPTGRVWVAYFQVKRGDLQKLVDYQANGEFDDDLLPCEYTIAESIRGNKQRAHFFLHVGCDLRDMSEVMEFIRQLVCVLEISFLYSRNTQPFKLPDYDNLKVLAGELIWTPERCSGCGFENRWCECYSCDECNGKVMDGKRLYAESYLTNRKHLICACDPDEQYRRDYADQCATVLSASARNQ